MELVKLIPQAFFDLFARLVPGLLALVLWFGLFGSPDDWATALQAVTADRLDSDNVVATIAIVGLVGAYTIGQLTAPFGKLLQRFAERLAKEMDHEKGAKKEPKEELKDYDWLRANHPGSGALAAKIRAESTMFAPCRQY